MNGKKNYYNDIVLIKSMCRIKYNIAQIHCKMLLILNDQSTVIKIPNQHEVQNC